MKQFLFLALSFICFKGQSQWIQQTTNISSPNQITGLHFCHPDTGFIVGGSGSTGSGSFISKTTDGGQTWKACTNPLGSTISLGAVQMINGKIAYAVGLDITKYNTTGGVIIKTIDGGTTWLIQNSNTYPGLLGLHFLSKDSGFAVGYNGTILKTIDGGVNWVKITSGVTDNLRDIDFPTSSIGYIVVEYNKILKSTDKGNNWSVGLSGTTNILLACDFTNDKKGYVCGNSVIQMTNDGGATWSTFNVSGFLQDIYFPNRDTGYAVGGDGQMLKTTDAGITWKKQTISGFGTYGFYEVFFLTSSIGYSGGYDGRLYKTTNGGGIYTGPSTEVKSEEIRKAINIFPNPSNGNFTFSLNYPECIFEIIDSYGKIVYHSELNNEVTFNLELGYLPKGIYIIRIAANKVHNSSTQQLVIY